MKKSRYTVQTLKPPLSGDSSINVRWVSIGCYFNKKKDAKDYIDSIGRRKGYRIVKETISYTSSTWIDISKILLPLFYIAIGYAWCFVAKGGF